MGNEPIRIVCGVLTSILLAIIVVRHRDEGGRVKKGVDMVTYALVAGTVTTAAGALFPAVSLSILTVFSKIDLMLRAVAGV